MSRRLIRTDPKPVPPGTGTNPGFADTPAGTNQYVIASALRTLQVLNAFSTPPHRYSLAELTVVSGLEKNQLYRSLKTLEAAGFLRSDDESRFSLTAVITRLSAAVVQGRHGSLTEVAGQHLDQLAEESGESVHLAVLNGERAVFLDRRESRHQVRLASVTVGSALPLHAGAVPKAILAFLPEAQQERVLAELGRLPRYTETTTFDPQRLRAELETIRSLGYAVSDGDYDAAARGVGAPIFDATGAVVGGISVGGPSFRVGETELARLTQLIVRVTRAVSQGLGHTG